jgi:hypothetical protein
MTCDEWGKGRNGSLRPNAIAESKRATDEDEILQKCAKSGLIRLRPATADRRRKN